MTDCNEGASNVSSTGGDITPGPNCVSDAVGLVTASCQALGAALEDKAQSGGASNLPKDVLQGVLSAVHGMLGTILNQL